MKQARIYISICISAVFFLLSAIETAQADSTLPIDPVIQQTPEWCWAASSQMVLQYLGYPNLNRAGNYQCGVVGAQGGACSANCAFCLGAGGTMYHIAQVINAYTAVAFQYTGYRNPTAVMHLGGIMSPQQIIDTIENDSPILAGISPGQIPFPPGLGLSLHAVVIVGYEGDASNLSVLINDPYPYPISYFSAPPYIQAGGRMLQLGQYEIPYSTFVNVFHYGNSIAFR
jgi:Papain-like cysteine protease AvrRpt2